MLRTNQSYKVLRMFDLPHILYISISTLLTVGLLTVFVLYLKDEKQKRLVLKISAISTVILHYSGLYVDYFTQGYAEASVILLLPVYPCHIAMWFLLVTAFCAQPLSVTVILTG